MATPVRLFAHDAAAPVPVYASQSYQVGVLMLKQPELARENVSVDTVVAAACGVALSASAGTAVLHMEAAPGKRIAFRLTNCKNGETPLDADASSAVFENTMEVPFGVGYRVSLLDVS